MRIIPWLGQRARSPEHFVQSPVLTKSIRIEAKSSNWILTLNHATQGYMLGIFSVINRLIKCGRLVF